MKHTYWTEWLLSGAFIALAPIGCTSFHSVKHPRNTYPSAAITNVVDTYHGVSVSDPYRWLEDENSPGTHAWIEAQNAITFRFLESLPEREPLRRRLTELYQVRPVRRSPGSIGGNSSIPTSTPGIGDWRIRPSSWSRALLDSEPSVLLDPNRLSADGTIALKSYSPNDDGSKVVCALSVAGSDWEEWKVYDVITGKETGDVLNWVKFSGSAWTRDGSGFFYSRYDAPPDFRQAQQGQRVSEALLP